MFFVVFRCTCVCSVVLLILIYYYIHNLQTNEANLSHMDYIVIILRLIAPNTPGADGEVARTGYIQRLKLSNSAKSKYPLVLLKLMKRYADDLIWANKIEEGGQVFRFIIGLTENRMDASGLRKG